MDPEYSRYSCQMNLPGFGREAQQKLANAKILIAGAGGLGCPAALYLAAAGVGTIGIADYDMISTSNLHRQVLYTDLETGLKKVDIASRRLKDQNPEIEVIPVDIKISSENVLELIKGYDLIIDCTDNFETRYLLNDAAVLCRKPLVYGAIYQYEGQVAVWNLLNEDGSMTPNYRDLFPEVDATQVPNCADGGVIPTLAGIIGCMQANEVIKYITNTGELLAGKLLLLDASTLQSRTIKIGSRTKTNITRLQATEPVYTISANDFRKASSLHHYQLVDIRNDDEHESFNIGGVHIPLNRLEKDIHSLAKAGTIVFYCATGKRSAEAVKITRKYLPGVDAVSLEGGLKAWVQDR